MNEPLVHLPVTYQSVLRDFLAQPDEAFLQQAYDLGRAALNAGLGVFDVVRLHHQAIADGVLPGEEGAARYAPALESFLLEVLSPFEAAHRGYRRARERLQQLNTALAERNEALTSANTRLQEEIATRQRTEAELRESREHYVRLFHQTHEMEQSLRELSAQVLTAQEEERKRISRELHDEIGQTLTAVNVAIAMLKRQVESDPKFQRKVAEAEELLSHSMETVHNFARELRPAMLDHLGLHSALRAHAAEFSHRTGIDVEIEPDPALSRLDGQRSEVLFRIAQEALTNVFKHTQATKVVIEFSSTDEAMQMEITDNGKSGSPRPAPAEGRRSPGLGLLGMQERARLVQGSFEIGAAPGGGTRVRVGVPFAASESPPVPIGDNPPSHTPLIPAPLSSNKPSHHEKNIRIAR